MKPLGKTSANEKPPLARVRERGTPGAGRADASAYVPSDAVRLGEEKPEESALHTSLWLPMRRFRR